MPRPDRSDERRRALAPALARAFASVGFRRATTAGLADACGVQEKALFRLWPDKRAMFLAALDQVFDASESLWARLAKAKRPGRTAAETLLDYESRRHGEHGLYRIVFAGLSESDDPEVRRALAALFGRFQRLIQERVVEHRGTRAGGIDAALAAWAIVGLGTVANIGREIGLLDAGARARLMSVVGARLLSRT